MVAVVMIALTVGDYVRGDATGPYVAIMGLLFAALAHRQYRERYRQDTDIGGLGPEGGNVNGLEGHEYYSAATEAASRRSSTTDGVERDYWPMRKSSA